MNDDATRWLVQAADDFDTANILFNAARYGPCAFFCQQAAEKALKAALYGVRERPWGHNLASLVDQVCIVLEINVVDAPQAEAQALDEHYMRPRYPDARAEVEAEYDQSIAQEALRDAQVIMAFVRRSVAYAGQDADDPASADLG